MTIKMSLGNDLERKNFSDVIASLVAKGLTFECVILGSNVTITLTGGF
jgi:hypothetical protein